MADLNQSYDSAKSQINSIKTYKDISAAAKQLKSSAGNSFAQSTASLNSSLDKISTQQKIVNDCVEKKISLSKLQSSIWEKSNNNNNESFSLADLDDDLIQNLIDKDVSNDEETYKMK